MAWPPPEGRVTHRQAQQCPENMTTNATGAASLLECACDAGYLLNPLGICESCPAGGNKYKAAVGNIPLCEGTCPGNSLLRPDSRGARGPEECVCPEGEGQLMLLSTGAFQCVLGAGIGLDDQPFTIESDGSGPWVNVRTSLNVSMVNFGMFFDAAIPWELENNKELREIVITQLGLPASLESKVLIKVEEYGPSRLGKTGKELQLATTAPPYPKDLPLGWNRVNMQLPFASYAEAMKFLEFAEGMNLTMLQERVQAVRPDFDDLFTITSDPWGHHSMNGTDASVEYVIVRCPNRTAFVEGERFLSLALSCECAPGYMPNYLVVDVPEDQRPAVGFDRFGRPVPRDEEFEGYPAADIRNLTLLAKDGPTCWPCVSSVNGVVRGYYKDTVGNEKCKQCWDVKFLPEQILAGNSSPWNSSNVDERHWPTTEPVTGANAKSACLCRGGSVKTGPLCIPCDPGTYAEVGAAECGICMENTYSEEGWANCTECEFLYTAGAGSGECFFQLALVIVVLVSSFVVISLLLFLCCRKLLRNPTIVKYIRRHQLRRQFKQHLTELDKTRNLKYEPSLFRRGKNGELETFTVPADCIEFGDIRKILLCLEERLFMRGSGNFYDDEALLASACIEVFFKFHADVAKDCIDHEEGLQRPIYTGILSFLIMYNEMFDKLQRDEELDYQAMTDAGEKLKEEATGDNMQSTGEILPLWEQALNMRWCYAKMAEKLKSRTGIAISLAKPKHLWRILEKSAFNHRSAARVCDVTRGMVTCEDFHQHTEVIEFLLEYALVCHAIEIARVKQRYNDASPGGWRDIMVNFVFTGDTTRHVCELQIVHSKMLALRSGAGGHHDYSLCRTAIEFVEFVQGERELARILAEIMGSAGTKRERVEFDDGGCQTDDDDDFGKWLAAGSPSTPSGTGLKNALAAGRKDFGLVAIRRVGAEAPVVTEIPYGYGKKPKPQRHTPEFWF